MYFFDVLLHGNYQELFNFYHKEFVSSRKSLFLSNANYLVVAVTRPTSTYTKHVARKNKNYYYSWFQIVKIGLNVFIHF